VLRRIVSFDAAHLHRRLAYGTDGPPLFACTVCVAYAVHAVFVGRCADRGGCDCWKRRQGLSLSAIDLEAHPDKKTFHGCQCHLELGWVVIPEFAIIRIEAAFCCHPCCTAIYIPLAYNSVGNYIVKERCRDVASCQAAVGVKRVAKECLLPWNDHMAFPEGCD